MKRVLTLNELIETANAEELHSALAAVNITEIPVMSNDRHIGRKAQAKLARQLFAKLGLKKISVTAPNYSMAQSVDVSLPTRRDYGYDENEMDLDVRRADPARKSNFQATERIQSILLAAFPNHEDRSDVQSDHFDYCWSVR